ncbi:hypothetical protein [Sphingomonas bacterium]|uniref:hypothetical protein n=1 Tax=Sphingomonas bacterium TaxID=1895847 RepID=UPI0015762F6F|nr:hypothetical protein [Sphingomonas bacterium]
MEKRGREVKEAMVKDEADRAARLAEALRANLKRRKAQARALREVPPPVIPPEAPSRD